MDAFNACPYANKYAKFDQNDPFIGEEFAMKKLFVLVLAIAMLGFFGVAQAASDIPEILGSVESNAYQTMSDEQMDKIAGELIFGIANIFGNQVAFELFNSTGPLNAPGTNLNTIAGFGGPGSFATPFFYFVP